MEKLTDRKIKKILRGHAKFLLPGSGGHRAVFNNTDISEFNFNGADIKYASFENANLSHANLNFTNLRAVKLECADLHNATLLCADLESANITRANLEDADLSYANLRDADFGGANLYGAKLGWANLYGAKLGWANLDGAKGLPPIACPEVGSFIGFKKCSDAFIVELQILEDAKRSSATTRKCRCSKARVLSITKLDGSAPDVTEVRSTYDPEFIYKIGEIVEVPDFDENRWKECAPGIHFFLSRQEAVEY